MPTTRDDLDTAIAHIADMGNVMASSTTPHVAISALKAALPSYKGDFLLSLIAECWGTLHVWRGIGPALVRFLPLALLKVCRMWYCLVRPLNRSAE